MPPLIRARADGPAIAPSEITPRSVWAARRALLGALLSGGAAAIGLPPGAHAEKPTPIPRPGQRPALDARPSPIAGAVVLDKPTRFEDASTYNNFYEFGTDKADPARLAHRMRTDPWSVDVGGLVQRPRRFSLEELLRLAPLEERIYRLRCVEGWSMVIPWVGYSLSELLQRVGPLGSARYVVFESLADAATMPGVRSPILDWPYTEGLRLDEALHPLTLLCMGMYGEVLPPQNGASVRIIVPWKYGFKSAKSIVRIRLVEHQPLSSWTRAAPREYGFYSNVNPDVPHPRWSQATERRIGEDGLLAKRRKTLLFNGYEAQVAHLYAGMDLRQHF